MTAKLSKKEELEIERLEKFSKKSNSKWLFAYLIGLLSFIYIVDEVTSALNGSIQSSLVTEFFVNGKGMGYNEGLSSLGAMTQAFMLIGIIAPFYKSLSDRFGRKIFLATNTIGMGVGLFICYSSTTLIQYLIGYAIASFFIAHDMQIVYIMEIAPEKWRGTLYSTIKAIASLGILLIPLLRQYIMKNDPANWRSIMLLPAILGFAFGFLALFTAPESPYFVETRLKYLKSNAKERDTEKQIQDKNKEDGKGGVGRAFKFMFKHKQLRWLSVVNLIFFGASAAISYYESIMSTGGMTTEQITQALFLYPFINALITFLSGFLADRIGRKSTAVTMCIISVSAFILFIVGVSRGWSPYIIGGCYGAYFGSFWSTGDIIGGIMCGESSPTRLRASIMSAQTLLMFVPLILSTIIMLVGMLFVENLGILCLAIMVPVMLISLYILQTKVGDTKGLDLNKVRGDEWD